MNKKYSTFIELSRSAMIHNLDFIRETLGSNVKFSSVVKGNAYGHGIEFIVPMQEGSGVDHFSVFNAEEAIRVKDVSNGKSDVMIMGMLTEDQMGWAIEKGIEFYIFSHERMVLAKNIAEKVGRKAKVHVEAETGMNRTGFDMKELTSVYRFLAANKDFFEFKGLCTHFAGAESIANYYRIQKQKKNFRSAVRKLNGIGAKPERLHTACSAAVISYPDTRMDMARIGIMQYGFFPSREVFINYLNKKKIVESPLKRILSWKSQVMTVKKVARGEFIGYGTSYFTNHECTIATVPVGYSHGFSRSLSNHGKVLIRGQFAQVLGIVNMNMMSVNISNIDGVQPGDEVVLIGHQGEIEVSVSSFSEISDLVNYELLARLPSTLPRVLVD